MVRGEDAILLPKTERGSDPDGVQKVALPRSLSAARNASVLLLQVVGHTSRALRQTSKVTRWSLDTVIQVCWYGHEGGLISTGEAYTRSKLLGPKPMSEAYRNNHYVAQWYQKRFLIPGQKSNELYYLDLKPRPFIDELGTRRPSRNPAWLTPMATKTDTWRTSPPQLRFKAIPSRYTNGNVPSNGRLRHASIVP